MIILNKINHSNFEKIEYHFSNDEYKGSVFKLLLKFDVVEDDEGHLLVCEYEELEHILNEELEQEKIKSVCEVFSESMLKNLYQEITDQVKKSNLTGE